MVFKELLQSDWAADCGGHINHKLNIQKQDQGLMQLE